MTQNIKTGPAIIIAGILIAGAIVATNWSKGPRQEAPETPGTAAEARPIGADDHVLGDRSARIQLIEYSDTECPFCKRYHGELKAVAERHQGDLAIAYRHFPIESLHKQAMVEAAATECAARIGGNDAFWMYLDRIFETTTSNDGLDLALLPSFAEELDIDAGAFDACMRDPAIAALVEEDLAEGRALGVRGTPTTFIIDTKTGSQSSFVGARSADDLSAAIGAMLEE